MQKTFISPIDPDDILEITPNQEEFLGFSTSKDRSNIIICGQTRSGKTTFLQNLLFKSLLGQSDMQLENVYIFSKTASEDMSYRPLIMTLMYNTSGMIKIFDNIDMKKINEIISPLKEKNQMNMISEKKDRTPLKKTLFIFDDIIGDKQLGSYASEFSNFTTRSRHLNIINIFLTQDYVAIPTKIR